LPRELEHVAPLAAAQGARPRRSLILAGGGMRVAYQAGVLRALEEAGLNFFHADGTSGGTMNLAMLLSGNAPAEMCERWRTLDVRDFISMLPLRKYLRSFNWPAFGDSDGLVQSVYPHLGIDIERIRAARGIEGTFNVCDYTNKTNVAVPHTEISEDLLIAGVSLPMFMPPIPHGGALYTDSVWIKDANPTEAVRRGCEEIWLVWCIGNSGVYRSGAFNQYVHMIELSANGKLFEEFAHLRAELGSALPRLHVIKPEYPLPLDPDYYFGRIDAAALLASGYRDAMKYLAVRSDEGIPWDPAATQMRDPPPGAAFSDRLEGTLELGAATGALAVELRVDIRALDQFLTNRQRTGELVAVIDSDTLGRCLPARTGSFALRAGTLRYEFVVSPEGRDLCLALDVPARPWRSAVVTVYEGSTAEGSVVGTGTVGTGVRNEVGRLRSLHTTGPGSTCAGMSAVAKLASVLVHGR
jgi:predicted acylesterase/phospholipase RssA